MRQFGYPGQNIPDPIVPIDSNPVDWTSLLNETIELWTRRHDYVVQFQNPPIAISEYEYWYWQITRRYILKSSSRLMVAYIPRAPLEVMVQTISVSMVKSILVLEYDVRKSNGSNDEMYVQPMILQVNFLYLLTLR